MQHNSIVGSISAYGEKTLGTGLIIGTGQALANAGPGSLFFSYTFIGAIVFLVMAAMGDMAA